MLPLNTIVRYWERKLTENRHLLEPSVIVLIEATLFYLRTHPGLEQK